MPLRSKAANSKVSPVNRPWKIEPRPIIAAIAPIFVALAIIAFPATAQDAGVATDHLASLRDCQKVADPSDRLTCYDASVGNILAREGSGEIRVVDQQDIKETRKSLFGFSLPRIGIFGSQEGEADSILQSQITGVNKLASDKWLITITEGSVWQVSNAPRRFRPEVGDSIELEKAAMTSYWLRVDGALGVKGRRVE